MQQQAVRTAAQPVAKLGGGQLLAAISNAFVSMLREFYGRGPMKAKTYALDDIIVIVLRNSGYSAIEKTMMDPASTSASSICARTSSASWPRVTQTRSSS